MTPTARRIRKIFSDNLAILIGPNRNISHLAKDLDIKRTQLNRYRFGTSWPNPDVLDKICRYFGTDARILTEPLAEIGIPAHRPTSTYDRETLLIQIAHAIHDGPLGFDDYAFNIDTKRGQMCMEMARVALDTIDLPRLLSQAQGSGDG